MRLAILITLIALGASQFLTPARAADISEVSERKLSRLSLSYILSFPTVSTASFLDNTFSYRGVGVEWNSPTGLGDLHLGLSLRWLYFQHDEDQGSITAGDTTVTGRIYRSIDSFPIALLLRYPFFTASTSRVVPFIGLGIGTTYGRRELNVGAFSQNQFGWQFLMAPEAGAEIKVSKTSDINGYINVRYDAGFGSDAISAISNLSLALGVASHFE